MALIDAHEPIGFRKWQGPQEHGVDRREDGAVGSDTEPQREDDDARKSGMLAALPNA
jgi:hypothetical protein